MDSVGMGPDSSVTVLMPLGPRVIDIGALWDPSGPLSGAIIGRLGGLIPEQQAALDLPTLESRALGLEPLDKPRGIGFVVGA